MGRLRIETVAKILAAPIEERDLILKDYVTKKTTKLLVEREALDCFEKYPEVEASIVDQLDIANAFSSTALENVINNQSPYAVAQSSHDLIEVLHSPNHLRSAKDLNARVSIYETLVGHLARSDLEPFNRRALIDILKAAFREIPKEQWRATFRLPLAAAISLRFEGLPSQRAHRQEMCRFMDHYFSGDLAAIAAEIKHELRWYNKNELSDLVEDCLAERSREVQAAKTE